MIEAIDQTLSCCGYDNPEAVKWNPHNQVVQCHNCGQAYTPQRQPLTDEQRKQIGEKQKWPPMCDSYMYWFFKGMDETEAAHGIKDEV